MKRLIKLSLVAVLFGFVSLSAGDPCSSLKDACEVGKCIGSAVNAATYSLTPNGFKSYTKSVSAISTTAKSVHSITKALAQASVKSSNAPMPPASSSAMYLPPTAAISITDTSSSNCAYNSAYADSCGQLSGVTKVIANLGNLKLWTECLLHRQNTVHNEVRLFINEFLNQELSEIKDTVSKQYKTLGISQKNEQNIVNAAKRIQKAAKALDGWQPGQCEKVTIYQWNGSNNKEELASYYRWKNALPSTAYYGFTKEAQDSLINGEQSKVNSLNSKLSETKSSFLSAYESLISNSPKFVKYTKDKNNALPKFHLVKGNMVKFPNSVYELKSKISWVTGYYSNLISNQSEALQSITNAKSAAKYNKLKRKQAQEDKSIKKANNLVLKYQAAEVALVAANANLNLYKKVGRVTQLTSFPPNLVYTGQTSNYGDFSLLSIYSYLLTQLPHVGAALTTIKLNSQVTAEQSFGNCKTRKGNATQDWEYISGAFFVGFMMMEPLKKFGGWVYKKFGGKVAEDANKPAPKNVEDANNTANNSNVENQLAEDEDVVEEVSAEVRTGLGRVTSAISDALEAVGTKIADILEKGASAVADMISKYMGDVADLSDIGEALM